MVWPKKWFAAGLAGTGSKEMAAIAIANLLRVYLANRLANLVRVGDGLLFLRDRVAFRAFFIEQVILGLSSRFLDAVSNYMRDRLGRIWREKMTDIMHRDYFANSAYYHVEQKIQDADSRITEDIKLLADGFTKFYTAGMYTATTGIFYSIKL